ncbi:hypothetical protein [Streptomyces sp. NPDC047315]|uniref:hypothetical protein n=1 Tax=Streptomyces sp. NPDC047315 TaxID=3155142 RepID=UPI003405A419
MTGNRRRLAAGTLVLCAVLAVPLTVHAVSESDGTTGAKADGARPDSDSGRPDREPTRQEKDSLYRAEQLLLRDCMRRHGFVYQPVPKNPVPEAREFPYVVDDVAWARRHGYGSDIDRESARLRDADPNQRYFQNLPPERRAAALEAANGRRPVGLTAKNPDGTTLTRSDQGCRTDAERALYGDVQQLFQARSTAGALPDVRRSRVLADPRFAKATKPWARCMRAAGHPYDTPADLRQKLPSSDRPLPRQQEIQLAVAEATCAGTSGLAETAASLDRQYDHELRQRHRADLETGYRLQLAAVPRARSVVK